MFYISFLNFHELRLSKTYIEKLLELKTNSVKIVIYTYTLLYFWQSFDFNYEKFHLGFFK